MSGSISKTLDIELHDADSESQGSLGIRIVASDNVVSIYPQGFGDCGSADGHGCPIFLELYQGRFRVVTFPDINQEEPTIIDMTGAKEDCRNDRLLNVE